MTISKSIREAINKIEPGKVFGIKDFSKINNPQAVILELSRISKTGTIRRLTKGKYFIPKKSKFGELGPSESEILTSLLKDNGGYFAGAMALNRIGVTTQIPSEILIRGARSTRTLKIGKLNIRFVKQGLKNIEEYQSKISDVLEALRLIKKTPDGDIHLTINRVTAVVKEFNKAELNSLINIALTEQPFVRAILGAILETLKIKKSKQIKTTLNQASKYKLGLLKNIIPNAENWGIV